MVFIKMRQVSPPNDWHRADIKAAIERAGYTQERLSTDHGYAANAVSVCLCKPWPKVEQIIADTIDTPARKIWPTRYDETGLPIKRGATKESKRPKSGRPQARTRHGSNKKRRAA